MTTIQRLLEFKKDQLAVTRLAIKQLERKLEELEQLKIDLAKDNILPFLN